jgi:hypothetical protein
MIGEPFFINFNRILMDVLYFCNGKALVSEDTDARRPSSSGVSILRSKSTSEIKITRQVEVSEELLGADGDITYVDPALLMTQASASIPTTTSAMNRPGNLLKRSNSGSEVLQTNEAQVDLAGVFKRITNKSMIIPRDPTFDTSKVANPPTDARKEAAGSVKTIAHFFGLQAQQPSQQQQQQQQQQLFNASQIKEDALSGNKEEDVKFNSLVLKRQAVSADRKVSNPLATANLKLSLLSQPAAPKPHGASMSSKERLFQSVGR